MDEEKIPELMRLLFGEAAGVAWTGASERLRRWTHAFEDWLQERRRLSLQKYKDALWYWGQLLGRQPRMPWELQRQDFESHAAWMHSQGYADATVVSAFVVFSSFYHWSAQQQVDPACGPGFDPSAQVTRPTTTPFANTRLLSDAEVEALLAALRRDTSPLGLRDAAFILARLRLGVPLRYLQRLQWGMLTHDPSGVWVRWQSGEEPSPLPAEVWEALRAYLAASGRLQGMRPGKFIFAPIRRPPGLQKSARAQGWHEELYITTPQLLRNLKLYGRLAGIPEEKLTLQVLRHTAVRLRLDAGDSMPEIKAFLHGRESVDSIKYRLGFLPELPQEQAGQAPVMADPPDREAKPFREGQGVKHGFYAKRRPPEGVQAVMAEGARGLAAELEGLRELGRGLLEREEQAQTRQAASLLVEAYSKAAARLGELSAARKAEQEGDEEQEVSWAEDFLQAMQEVSDEHGLGMDKDAVRAEALGGEGRLEEEIAAMRYLLRKVRQQALEAGEGREYVRLVEIYSTGCLRLARLLRREGDQRQRLERSIRKWTDKALSEVVDEMGLK